MKSLYLINPVDSCTSDGKKGILNPCPFLALECNIKESSNSKLEWALTLQNCLLPIEILFLNFTECLDISKGHKEAFLLIFCRRTGKLS